MRIEELVNELTDKVANYSPSIVILENIETGETKDKFIMAHDTWGYQVFGLTQEVLDVIDLTDEELINYIITWTEACSLTVINEGAWRVKLDD